MPTFNWKRFADSQNESANLIFICNRCGRKSETVEASACPDCAGSFFRVARTGNDVTMNNQLKDPYFRDEEEDGKSRVKPGDSKDFISSPGFGQNSRGDQSGHDEISLIRHDDIQTPGNNLPGDHDGLKDGVDQRSGDGDPLQSPAMSADNSPFNPMNYKEPLHIGPFNMHKSLLKPESVFERIRRKRKEALQ